MPQVHYALSKDSPVVVVFGGSGFVGRHVVRLLAKKGYRIRVACRRPHEANFLQPLGAVGQIQMVQCNLRYPLSIDAALDGVDHVVNLVGILHETSKQKFSSLQAEGAKLIAEKAKERGIKKIVHVSAIGADLNSPSEYGRTKAKGENAILEILPKSVILRPSLIFGPEDKFFNLFASLTSFLPFLPLVGFGDVKFQPVYVGDVAEAVFQALEGNAKDGGIYELGGDEIFSYKELMQIILKTVNKKRFLFPYPMALWKLEAFFLQMLPKPLITVDQVKLLERDNVVSETAISKNLTAKDLGIVPRKLSAILPTYLWRFRKGGQYATYDEFISDKSEDENQENSNYSANAEKASNSQAA